MIERRYRDRLDADADQFIRYITDGVAQMQQLIADLLNYSRVGKRGRPFGSVELDAVMGRVLTNLDAVVKESGAVVKCAPLPSIVGDETQLMQLFQNLISNAVKFCGDRRPEIVVSAQAEEDRWRFAVSDNGIGIDRRYWDRLFVIFQRLHSRQKYSRNGNRVGDLQTNCRSPRRKNLARLRTGQRNHVLFYDKTINAGRTPGRLGIDLALRGRLIRTFYVAFCKMEAHF